MPIEAGAKLVEIKADVKTKLESYWKSGKSKAPDWKSLINELLEDVVNKLEWIEDIASKLGVRLASPFATLSFLALPVIPELRLTDKGLVDVLEFRILS